MKLLLYCTKSKPTLYNVLGKFITTKYMGKDFMQDGITRPELNGKIVAECDYEIEKIKIDDLDCWNWFYITKSLFEDDLCENSCLSRDELYDYLGEETEEKVGYAIHIKNLNIFDKPKELSDCCIIQNESANPMDIEEDIKIVKKAPQNMCKVWIYENGKWVMYILISVRPEWLCKILNGEKTIEVRKKVLKEMLEK